MCNENSGSSTPSCGALSKYCPANIVENFFDRRLKQLQKLASPKIFDIVFGWAEKIGHLAIYPTLLLGLIFAITAGSRLNDYEFMVRAVVFILIVAVLHYAVIKIFRLNDRLLEKTREITGTAVVFNCLAMVCAFGGILLLIGDVYVAGKYGPARVIDNLVRFLSIEAMALIALNFKKLYIEENDSASLGESALALFAFIAKALLMQAKVIFCVFTLLTFVGLFRSTLLVCGKDSLWEGVNAGIGNVRIILIAVGLPVILTLAYLALNLIFSLWRAILSLNANK